MDRRDDERVPDELKEAAEWMREARTEPTPLQLDELKQRAHRQAARRGGSGARWRIRAVTTLLVGGLMMTSLTGVVLATGGTGSSSFLNSLYELFQHWNKPDKDPSHSQYCPPKPHSVSYTTTSGGGHHDDDDDGDDCIPCPPKTMSAKTSGGGNHHGDDDDDGDVCDPCKSSTASSKTSSGGSHPSDPCDPCKSSSAGSKTYTSGGSHGGHDPCDPKPGCGPDKTNGTAGNSGTHQGQPPKDQNRGDCPKKPPTAKTGSASSITKYSAKLNGTVNPNGKSTTGLFEYSKGGSGASVGSQSLGSGTSTKSLSASISNLSKDTTYYFRVVGKNADGTTNGSVASFKTAKY